MKLPMKFKLKLPIYNSFTFKRRIFKFIKYISLTKNIKLIKNLSNYISKFTT